MMTRAIDKTHRSQKLGLTLTIRTDLARRIIGWRLTRRTLIEGGVGIPDTNRDTSSQFLRMPSGPYACQCLHNGALSIIDMTKGTNVDLRLQPKVAY